MQKSDAILPSTPLAEIFRLTPLQKAGLAKLKIASIYDLLYYFPSRYSTIAEIKLIRDVTPGEHVIIYGRVVSAKSAKGFYSKIPMTEAVIEDGTGRLKVVWFHQAYIAKMLIPDAMVKLSGRVEERRGSLYLANPELERAKELPIDGGDSLFGRGGEAGNEAFFFPVYPETKGVTSRFLYHHVQNVFSRGVLDSLSDPVPETILKRYNLPSLKTALVWIHAPQKESDAEAARKRFAFEEIFIIQLSRQRERALMEAHDAWKIIPNPLALERFIARFPFVPTDGQKRALAEILADFKKGVPMARLLEGDVGSGKTFVAAAAAYAAAAAAPKDNKYGSLQVAYMAPTEILAMQHFKSFIEYFKGLPIEIGLLTGTTCKKFPSKVDPTGSTTVSRAQLLKWVAEGTLPILIGTHALIQKSVHLKNLALVIVDEQHRFGTTQRGKLAHKEELLPHFLSMTATPIPRTLALTIYGNLDLTLLDQMPSGRLPIKTELVLPTKRKHMEDNVRALIQEDHQAYIICPRIDEPDPDKALALNTKSVKAEAKRLAANVFPEYTIDILHGKMTPVEKERVMSRFGKGEIDILVATSVVEVGVNVPNATAIVIEGAERFGLASLHQLRGRVMRSSHQAYCYLLTDSANETSLKRLKALATAKNGFELAELDLMLRGSGELRGGKQWGISDLGMEAIKNIKMVEAARNEAQKLIAEDPNLTAYPLLHARVDAERKDMHWE
ncbi:MAG: recombinase protein [Parcubacteria group bacterium GW2011_GWA2_49_16]|nr:MAG: recombinase protein [Parcubacteria group bacterium GW2011_GWA2_49_16]